MPHICVRSMLAITVATLSQASQLGNQQTILQLKSFSFGVANSGLQKQNWKAHQDNVCLHLMSNLHSLFT